jgi:hypothetical protein
MYDTCTGLGFLNGEVRSLQRKDRPQLNNGLAFQILFLVRTTIVVSWVSRQS